MIPLTIDKVDGFVAKLQRKGVNVRWDGWKMVFFKPSRRAERSIHGSRVNGQWGYETVVSPNRQGKWLVRTDLIRGTNG